GGWHGDAYSLPLNSVTRAHFSRLRALVCICTEPERYGLSLPDAPTTQLHGLAASEDRNEADGTVPTIKSPTIPATHVVARGESLWRVARRYRVALDNLRHWNALGTKSLLQPGQILRLTAP
ncbi:MAG: LysM peptidoglycan-binding domain-containing protein, partial [Lysobacterales bacterium]